MTLEMAAVVRRGTFTLGVSLTVAPGEVLGVLGPNGAGKTTLLRALAGLTAVTEGSIRLGDTVLDDAATGTFVPAERRPVGVVFQNYRLFPHLGVRDNVAFSSRSRGASRRDARRHADRYLHQLDLSALASRKPAQLSGGQAQRVALARALAADPGLLLLDEPLVGSRRPDPAGRAHRAAPTPGNVPGADPDRDARPAGGDGDDRPAAGHRGRARGPAGHARAGRGTPGDPVRRSPGRAQSLPGRLDGGGRHGSAAWRRRSHSSTRTVPLPPVGTHVLVAVRPSAIALLTERPHHASPRNVWAGTVAGLEMLADRVRARIDGPAERARRPHRGCRGRPRAAPGAAGVALREGHRGGRVPRGLASPLAGWTPPAGNHPDGRISRWIAHRCRWTPYGWRVVKTRGGDVENPSVPNAPDDVYDAAVWRALPWVSGILAVLYALFAGQHLLVLDGTTRLIMASTAAGTSLALAALWVRAPHPRPQPVLRPSGHRADRRSRRGQRRGPPRRRVRAAADHQRDARHRRRRCRAAVDALVRRHRLPGMGRLGRGRIDGRAEPAVGLLRDRAGRRDRAVRRDQPRGPPRRRRARRGAGAGRVVGRARPSHRPGQPARAVDGRRPDRRDTLAGRATRCTASSSTSTSSAGQRRARARGRRRGAGGGR